MESFPGSGSVPPPITLMGGLPYRLTRFLRLGFSAALLCLSGCAAATPGQVEEEDDGGRQFSRVQPGDGGVSRLSEDADSMFTSDISTAPSRDLKGNEDSNDAALDPRAQIIVVTLPGNSNPDAGTDQNPPCSQPQMADMGAASPNPSTPSFAMPVMFSNPLSTHAIAAADVNGDGRPDIVTGGSFGEVNVHINDGKGGFTRTPFAVFGTSLVDVQAASLNGGKVDAVVAADWTNGRIIVAENNNSFLIPKGSFPAGKNPTMVAVADVDGDGKLDLTTSNYGSGDVTTLLGQGGFQFSPPTVMMQARQPGAVAVGDLDRDGKPEMVVSESAVGAKMVQIRYGINGTILSVPVLERPWGVAIDKFGNPSVPKIVVGTLQGGTKVNDQLHILDPCDPNTQQHYTVGGQPRGIAVGDVNADGIKDILSVQNTTHTIAVLTGKADGTFMSPLVMPACSQVYGLATGDFDGDGRLDIVASCQTQPFGVVLLNTTP